MYRMKVLSHSGAASRSSEEAIVSGRCVVICSGGLDSTTVAAHAKYVDRREVTLLHFRYGCRAENREVQAVRDVANALDACAVFWDIEWLKHIGNSRLTTESAEIAAGIAGAEYPHEWVPARNLLFLAHTAAFCDAQRIDSIYMGLNLEEGAVYPDNTIEFYERAEQLLQFATLIRPQIQMPLARMMKWQIVRHAQEINGPIHLSWSCYRDGLLHCGRCGPCYMRRTAHRMLQVRDSVNYEDDAENASREGRARQAAGAA
jgi:7-cyano-7-deazaguanine synthase